MSPQLTILFWKKMVRIAENIVHCNQNHFSPPIFRDKQKIEKAKSKKKFILVGPIVNTILFPKAF